MNKYFSIKLFFYGCSQIAHNEAAAWRGSGSQALPYELPACKSSKYFQTKVVPLSRKTARCMSVAAFPRTVRLPIFTLSSYDGFFNLQWFSCRVPAADLEQACGARSAIWRSHFALCGLQYGVCGWLCRWKTRYCKLGKATVGTCQYLSVKPRCLNRSVRGGKKRIWRQIGAGHFVYFSVQNACAGICRHFLLRGGQGGVLCWICVSATLPCPQEKRLLGLVYSFFVKPL